MITKVWLWEAVPNKWSKAVLFPLFKKGDKRICSNYRGISLINVAANVYGVILLKKLKSDRHQLTRPNFKLHNLCRTPEQSWSSQQVTVLCFVDFASAFDSVDRDSLWRTMSADGIPTKLLRLIKSYYSSTKMKVRASGNDSMPLRFCPVFDKDVFSSLPS